MGPLANEGMFFPSTADDAWERALDIEAAIAVNTDKAATAENLRSAVVGRFIVRPMHQYVGRVGSSGARHDECATRRWLCGGGRWVTVAVVGGGERRRCHGTLVEVGGLRGRKE